MSAMLVLTLTSFSQNLKALDDKYGFREAKFEMSIDSIKNLAPTKESNCYKSTTENLKLGDYDLTEIVYIFYKGQLSSIMIKTNGYINSRGVLNVLQSAYGKGYKSNEYIEEYYWSGKKTIMVYDENSINHNATILLWSKSMNQIEKADKENANSKAANQL